MITDYKIVCGKCPLNLTQGVKNHINDGWQPRGEVFLWCTSLCQLMVKSDEEIQS